MPIQYDYLEDSNRKKCQGAAGCMETCIVEVQKLYPSGKLVFEHYCTEHLYEFEGTAYCPECGEATIDHKNGSCVQAA